MTVLLKVFDLVPGWVYAIALGIAGVLLAGQQVRVSNAKADAAGVRIEFADAKTQAAEARLLADRAQALEYQRREDNRRKEIDEAHRQTDAAARAALAADAARDGMQRALATYIARVRAREDSTPAARGPSQPGADALDLLAGLYFRADQGAGEIAVVARKLFIAGLTCERIHDGLSGAAAAR